MWRLISAYLEACLGLFDLISAYLESDFGLFELIPAYLESYFGLFELISAFYSLFRLISAYFGLFGSLFRLIWSKQNNLFTKIGPHRWPSNNMYAGLTQCAFRVTAWYLLGED